MCNRSRSPESAVIFSGIGNQKHQQWTPGRLKNWAQDIGAEVPVWVTRQLTLKAHPEQAYRVCLGLLILAGNILVSDSMRPAKSRTVKACYG